MAYVDGQVATKDAYGTIQGNGGAVDKISGDGTNDALQGHADFNQLYGGGGSDTFILANKFSAGAHEGASTNFADTWVYITDFQGAGGYSATNNDFVAFTGYSAGSFLTLLKTVAGAGTDAYFNYSITDAATGVVKNLLVHSLNGQALADGDYAFF